MASAWCGAPGSARHPGKLRDKQLKLGTLCFNWQVTTSRLDPHSYIKIECQPWLRSLPTSVNWYMDAPMHTNIIYNYWPLPSIWWAQIALFCRKHQTCTVTVMAIEMSRSAHVKGHSAHWGLSRYPAHFARWTRAMQYWKQQWSQIITSTSNGHGSILAVQN